MLAEILKGLKRRMGITSVLAPVHALIFLPPRHNQIVGLFRVGATDVVAFPATLLVIGNDSPEGLAV
jgi:hypothetical protein